MLKMRLLSRSGICLRVSVALALLIAPAAAVGQQRPSTTATKLRRIYVVRPVKGATPAMLKGQRFQANTASTIAFWQYTTTGYDGFTYQGMMVGRSPFAHGHRVTTIPTYVIPVKITFASDGSVYDPSAPDSCAGNAKVDDLVTNSPLFQNSDFVMNGVDVGTTQYLDAFQRANFWKQVQGTPYHTVFSTTPTVLAAVSVTVPAANGSTQNFGGCRPIGTMDINWFDGVVQNTILPGLAAQGVGLTNFPQILLDSVVMYDTTPSNCCILGYHSGLISGGNLQTYSVNGFDTSNTFGGTTDTMSHEIGEWMDDPNGSNPVPSWGAEGQVTAGNCQGNLEVGDPLSESFGTLTQPFSVTLNGTQYSLQELAFFSWFYGQSPSYGSGGGYSDNGSFTGFAIACPPGGSH